jgi:hypothetical protein
MITFLRFRLGPNLESAQTVLLDACERMDTKSDPAAKQSENGLSAYLPKKDLSAFKQPTE